MTANRLPLAITMGDAAGIGPEVIVKALAKPKSAGPNIVIGSTEAMQRAASLLDGPTEVVRIDDVWEAQFRPGLINVIETSHFENLPPYGHVSAASGRAAVNAIEAAVRLAKAGVISGITTAPINKAALSAAGVKFPGHTEMLAHLGGASHVAMMLANDDIRVVLVTVHCSLIKAIERADYNAQCRAIQLAYEGAQALGIENARIAVAGLNPHAGECGLFGREEIEIIKPAIEEAQARGIDVSGPYPADTLFMHARQGRFDIVVAQYHDQGLIPIKYSGLERGVNITLGLPFIRTSPDHGTAFDIAGNGSAESASLETALNYAWRLAATRNKGAT